MQQFISALIASVKRYLTKVKMSAVEGINNQAFNAWSAPSVSSIYEKTRPNYNLDSVEFLLEKVGALRSHSEPFTIVEVGAGTGKFTRAALKVLERRLVKNVKITSTEPIKEMCETFKEMVPEVAIFQRPANDLGLPNTSADAVLAAHCFHWFANDMASINELHKILKPNGILGIIWYFPDRSVSWIKTIEELLDPGFKKNDVTRPVDKDSDMFRQIKQHGGFGEENGDDSYCYEMEFDFNGIMERYKANSVVSSAGPEEKEDLLSKIEQEIKTNPDVIDLQRIIYKIAVKINWFEKT